MDLALSRPARFVAQLTQRSDLDAEHLFRESRVLIRLEPQLRNNRDARATFLASVNQTLRFCPNVAVGDAVDALLLHACTTLAAGIYAPGHNMEVAPETRIEEFDAILNIGTELRDGLPWSMVNSNGWLARIASADAAVTLPHQAAEQPNIVGALAAACLGVGHIFLRLIGRSVPIEPLEFSLWFCATSPVGEGIDGPALPDAFYVDGFLIGCGAVANGWAYTIKRSPAEGNIDAVDRQSLRTENIGPYVAVIREMVGRAKAEIMREILAPEIRGTPRPEEFELFKVRLEYGLVVPDLVVNGLDNVATRHAVQRLWPRTLIDMAAGRLTAQVIVKQSDGDGMCLLEALKMPAEEVPYEERVSQITGLRPERILLSPTDRLTQEDVDAAPPEHRTDLEAGRASGQLICGRITDQNLATDDSGGAFAPAVPFVTGLAGVMGGAETVRWGMGLRESRHVQFDFGSYRCRALALRCRDECECRAKRESMPA